MLRAVCRLSDLPATQGYLVEVGGEVVALFRVGDEVHAIENRCPHRDGPLAFGDLKGSTVYCPVHAWDFDVRTGRCGEFPRVAVRTFPVQVRGDEVLIELPEEGTHGHDD
ncbi:MAG TPA: Rieske 2Fe-2S domain-containing protein [Anaeromyxobacteraceae bacterium]|nr:Rieske 2Fe-2S domain-containing protein [Anaeromyxobacteraceae bacterium]